MTKLRIANSEIELGSKYVLDHRPDPKAPEGLKDMTKFPFDGNVTFEKVWFNDARRQYDTGFYDESPCLKIIKDEKQRTELVKQYVKYIKTPYEKTFNVSLDPSEKNDFWETYTIEAWVNKQYDTSNINDLMELFFILKNGAACEKDEKDPILRRDAQFLISSSEKIKNKSKQKVKTQAQTYMVFATMLNGDRDKLNLILQWLGKDDPSKVDSEDLGLIYYQIINGTDGVTFCEKFLQADEEFDTPAGKEKMEYFYAIKRLFDKRKIKRTNRGYVTTDGDIFLGNTLQNIAEFCINTSSAQHGLINDLIEEYPDVKRKKLEHLKATK